MNDHWHSNRTQIFWTCLALAQGRTINHMHEIGEVRGWRLGAIIHNLRHNYAWPIQTEYKGPERVAHYRLGADVDVMVLAYPRSAKGVVATLRQALGDAETVDG